MVIMKKSKKIAAGTVTVVACTALLISGINGRRKIELPYTISGNEYVQTLTIDIPEEVGTDICELYVNGQFVAVDIMPGGKLQAHPMVFSKMENTTVRMFKKGEHAGDARFEGDKLIYRRK